ncbi:uncharacterized protein [Argopecten irradians]|uniref:uncharacterized protein isoform X1 n=2 Tax=Argopecten irradians TaxID=31199 RepID=UPI0037159B65
MRKLLHDLKNNIYQKMIRLKITNLKEYLKSRNSYFWVQLGPSLGYYVLLWMIFFQIQWYIPNSWDPTPKIFTPPTPVPYGNVSKMKSLKDGITFVTAYFDLGSFQKGKFKTFGKHTYVNWMTAYSKFNNSVILFTDSSDIEELFYHNRKHFPSDMTRIVRMEQDELWAFKLAPQIKQIYSQPGYPRYHPNTVNERYPCAMHVKYEALEMVINKKWFNTKHLAWIDVGYFRYTETKFFTLETPPDFKKDHIAFMQISKFYDGMSAKQIIENNMVWIAGGMFLGQPDYLLTFIADYKYAVESLIAQKLMSTDQQVLYIMYSKESNLRARVPLQFYYHNCRCDWFFLGNICRYIWDMKHWPRPSVNYFLALAM